MVVLQCTLVQPITTRPQTGLILCETKTLNYFVQSLIYTLTNVLKCVIVCTSPTTFLNTFLARQLSKFSVSLYFAIVLAVVLAKSYLLRLVSIMLAGFLLVTLH